MDLEGMERLVAKMIMLNTAKMQELRSSQYELTPAEEADYSDRINERDWLYTVQRAILDQLLSEAGKAAKSKMDARQGMILESIRQAGSGREAAVRAILGSRAGPQAKERRPRAPTKKSNMTEDDKAFLESCGVKGEIW